MVAAVFQDAAVLGKLSEPQHPQRRDAEGIPADLGQWLESKINTGFRSNIGLYMII